MLCPLFWQAIVMLRLYHVNDALKSEGIDAELVKGEGYYWFDGNDVEFAKTTSVMVYRLNHLSLEQWIQYAKEFKEESKKVKESS